MDVEMPRVKKATLFLLGFQLFYSGELHACGVIVFDQTRLGPVDFNGCNVGWEICDLAKVARTKGSTEIGKQGPDLIYLPRKWELLNRSPLGLRKLLPDFLGNG